MKGEATPPFSDTLLAPLGPAVDVDTPSQLHHSPQLKGTSRRALHVPRTGEPPALPPVGASSEVRGQVGREARRSACGAGEYCRRREVKDPPLM